MSLDRLIGNCLRKNEIKPTGIVRRIDDLGRVVIPKALRKEFGFNEEGTPLEFFTANGELIIRKYDPERSNNES